MQRMTRRHALIAAAGAVGTLALAACSQATPAPAKPADTKPAESKPAAPAPTAASAAAPAAKAASGLTGTLTIWNGSSQMTKSINEAFAKAHPNLTVNLVDFGGNDLQEKLLVALATGVDLPDVTWVISRRAATYLRTNQFMDLTDVIRPYEAKFDSKASIITFKDRTYSYVMGPGNVAMWLRAAEMKKLGVDPDGFKTWDDALEGARRLKRDGGKTFLIQPNKSNGFNTFNSFFHSRGGNWWTPEGAAFEDAKNQQTLKETVEWWVNLKKEGLAFESDWVPPTFWEAMKSGRQLGYTMNFAVGVNNTQQNLPDQKGEWRMVTWPKWSAAAEQQTGAYGGVFYAVLKGTKNPEAAKAFVTWWLDGQGLEEHVKVWGLSAYVPARDLPGYQAKLDYFGGQQVPLDLSKVTYPPFNYWDWEKVEPDVGFAIEKAAAGEFSSQQAVDEAFKAVKKIASERK